MTVFLIDSIPIGVTKKDRVIEGAGIVETAIVQVVVFRQHRVSISPKRHAEVTNLPRVRMEIRRLPGEERAVRRYIKDLGLPYKRELEEIVDRFSLADDVDIVAEELEHRLGRHDTESYRAWVAIETGDDEDDLADTDGAFVGFVSTDIDEAPAVFDRPDRLVICDIYVKDRYRGTGLARELVERARIRARECGCAELTLDVDVENDRALAFYEKLGFEPSRHTMIADVPSSEPS